MKKAVTRDELDERIVAAFTEVGNKLQEIAAKVGSTRSQVYYRLRRMDLLKKPLAEGSLEGMIEKRMPLPKKGQIKRYICTSAQNNTYVNEAVWDNLLALVKHYDAQLLVGTFSYNQNKFGALAVKRGKKKAHQKSLWYDKKLHEYFSDKRLLLAHGLVWCGEMNIMPTAVDPLAGLETYSQRKSAIFPSTKLAMRSVATMKGEGTKLNFTTGTVTLMNYIQKKAGLVGEHHHVYGAVLVEVNSDGNWWVRQLDADKEGTIQDLDVKAELGKVTTGNHVEAITWGDLHAGKIDSEVVRASLNADTGMLAKLKPRVQFLHDVLEGVSINHHAANNCHEKFDAMLRGFDEVDAEFKLTANVINAYTRKSVKTVVVDSNHDGAWIDRWLREHDYRRDPRNAILFLELQAAKYKAIAKRDSGFNIVEAALRRHDIPADVLFLKTDESFKTCEGTIENGMHGHLGPNGARGTPQNLNKVGRRANTGHTHSAGIWNGLYVAGTSSNLDFGYNVGPSSWSHSHVVTYPNGKRTIITMYNGKWRA